MSWLFRMLLRRPRKADDPVIIAQRERSEAVLEKASRVLVEERRLDQMRASFRRAGARLGG